jgi:hypothetical protein
MEDHKRTGRILLSGQGNQFLKPCGLKKYYGDGLCSEYEPKMLN